MEEIWKDIPDYEGMYQVSSLGRVKSLSRKVYNGKVYYMSKERIMKQLLDGGRYFSVGLSKYSKVKTTNVHKLVAMAFLGHKPNGKNELVVNHKDFVRTNNILDNLEIITNRENTNLKHKIHSSKYTGVDCGKSDKKWRSRILLNGKRVSLGSFSDELEASKYYEMALESINNGTEIKVKRRITYSKYKGVTWYKKDKIWISQIVFNKQRKYIGSFKDEYQAHLAYQNELKKMKENE